MKNFRKFMKIYYINFLLNFVKKLYKIFMEAHQNFKYLSLIMEEHNFTLYVDK